MHELSIASAIADVARRHARGRRVARVEVRVGHLRQVVPRALGFAWELLRRETAGLEGAELAVEEVPARGRCRACGEEGPLPAFPLTCATCGAFDVEVTAGEELRVEALELDDDPDANVASIEGVGRASGPPEGVVAGTHGSAGGTPALRSLRGDFPESRSSHCPEKARNFL